MGIRTDLLVTEEIAESSDLGATPFEFERAKRVEAALSILEGKWKIVVLNRLHILHVDTTFLIHNSFHPRKTVQEQRLRGKDDRYQIAACSMPWAEDNADIQPCL